MMPAAKTTDADEESNGREILTRDQQARGQYKDCSWFRKPPDFPLVQAMWLSLLHTPRCHPGLD